MDSRDEVVLAEHHERLPDALNALKFADATGVAVYAREASQFAPEADRAEDTVIVVLRGHEATAVGRKALTELADVIRAALP